MFFRPSLHIGQKVSLLRKNVNLLNVKYDALQTIHNNLKMKKTEALIEQRFSFQH